MQAPQARFLFIHNFSHGRTFVKERRCEQLMMSDLGSLSYLLGMEIASIVYGYYFSIKDSKYIQELIAHSGLTNTQTAATTIWSLIFTRGPWMVFLLWIRHGTILFVVLSISLVPD